MVLGKVSFIYKTALDSVPVCPTVISESGTPAEDIIFSLSPTVTVVSGHGTAAIGPEAARLGGAQLGFGFLYQTAALAAMAKR